MNSPKVFIAKVNLTYQGEKRSAAIYEDSTAILDTGEVIQLTPEQYNQITAKIKQVERKTQAQRIEAAKQAAEQRRQQEEMIRKKEELEPEDEEYADEEEYDDDIPTYSEKQTKFFTKGRVVKIVASTLVYAAVVSGTLFGAKYLIDNHLTRVSVAQFATSMAKDQQITPNNLERLKMPESIYKELTEAAPGDVVLWENAQDIVGQYASMDAIKGQYVTTDYVTGSITENLWKADMTGEQKTFNLDFDSFNIDEIFPGSHISIKAIVSLPDPSGKGTMVENLTVNDAAALNRLAAVTAPVEKETPDPAKDGEEVPIEAADGSETLKEDGAPASNGTPDAAEAPKTETASTNVPDGAPASGVDMFSDVVVVDLKNNYNESLFDIYLRLASMTAENRRAYLTERASSSNAKEYSNSLTPTVMVLAVDDSQYNDLTIVKNMDNATLEFAGIPATNYDSTDEQNSLLMKFKEVQRDVNEIFSAARTK